MSSLEPSTPYPKVSVVVAALLGPTEGPTGICKQTHMVFSCSLILFMDRLDSVAMQAALQVDKLDDGAT